MFGLGMGEIILLVIIAVVLFGTNDLPKNLRKVAKGVGEFKKVASDAQRSWTEVRDDVARTIMSADLENTVREAVTGPLPAAVSPVASSVAAATDVAPEMAPEPSLEQSAVPQDPPEIQPEPIPNGALPTVRPADHAIARSSEGAPVDQHHDHHEERGTESGTPAASAEGIRKPV